MTPVYSLSFLQSWCLSSSKPVSNLQVGNISCPDSGVRTFLFLSWSFSPPPSIPSVSLVNKAVVDYFFVELGVERHFEALRHFLLMEDGEFAQSLSDLLFEKVRLFKKCWCLLCAHSNMWHVVSFCSLLDSRLWMQYILIFYISNRLIGTACI